MGKHDTHNMHDNSLDAYADDEAQLSDRATRILEIVRSAERPLTARQVLGAYCLELGVRHHDMNLVRPRISELVKDGWLEEAGKVKDAVTGKTVALFQVRQVEHQQELWGMSMQGKGEPARAIGE